MSYYLIFSIFLILVISVLTLLKKASPIRSKYPDFFNFLYTIVATFVGVFLAIFYNNKVIEKQEREEFVILLKSAEKEFEFNNKETKARIEMLTENIENTKSILFNYRFPYPSIFPDGLKTTIVMKNISANSYRAFSSTGRTLFTYSSI